VDRDDRSRRTVSGSRPAIPWLERSVTHHSPLLIIGAGPFGLSVGAYARDHGMDHVMLGKPMDFWTSNMPAGMYLR